VGCNRLLQCYLGLHMGQERELEAVHWGSGRDSLVFPARDDAIVLETNVEAFVRVRGSESSPETETDLVPFNRMYEPRIPLSFLDYSCGLDEDFVANQHARALLRQTRDREASEPINFLPPLKGRNTDKWKGCRYSSLAFGMSNFSRSRLYGC
jgi:hypothetical protein